MSLADLQRKYGRGPRRVVMNRAIRAELPGAGEVLDAIHALRKRAEREPACRERLDVRERERDALVAIIEAKYGIVPART